MKRLMTLVLGVALVFGVAANASAAFGDFAEIYFSAYAIEGGIGGNTSEIGDREGTSALLNPDDFLNPDGSFTSNFSFDTGLSVDELLQGPPDSNDDIVVAAYGYNTGNLPIYTAESIRGSSMTAGIFQRFNGYLSGYTGSADVRYRSTADTAFVSSMEGGGDEQGTLGGLIDGGTVLAEVGVVDLLFGEAGEKAGSIEYFIAESTLTGITGDTIQGQFNAVPVPSPLLLLGSGLLGLLGLRKKNRA